MSGYITTIIEFLNTLDLTHGVDSLADPTRLLAWLRHRSFATLEDPSIQDVAWAIEFREALREFVSGNSGAAPSGAAVEIVARASRTTSFRLEFSQRGGVILAPIGSGLEAAVASVLTAVHAAMAAGTWSRNKTCRNPECRLAFYDRSRNRSGIWCEMATCGNRMKARRFRERKVAGGYSLG